MDGAISCSKHFELSSFDENEDDKGDPGEEVPYLKNGNIMIMGLIDGLDERCDVSMVKG
jgi:hypothetical protein